jgi:peptide/nickel transport system permease protein
MKQAFKNPLFLIGFLFITGLVILSFIYTAAVHNKVHQVMFLFDKNGKLEAASPISPRWKLPFGTDRPGNDMLSKILLGAKYTILGALSVAAIRMAMAIPIGLFLGLHLKRYKKYIASLVDSFHFIPLTVIAFYILVPVLMEPENGFRISLFARMFLEVIILAALTVPVIAVVIGNETGRLIQNEYVMCAKTLGAGQWRLIIKHIIPGMKEKLFVLFGQQMRQALIVLSHLGYLKLFFGGSHVTMGGEDPPMSITYEWSGIIGDTFNYLHTAVWVPLIPISCFAVTMIAVSFMIEGYVQATAGHTHYYKKKRQKIRIYKIKSDPEKEEFVLVRKTSL